MFNGALNTILKMLFCSHWDSLISSCGSVAPAHTWLRSCLGAGLTPSPCLHHPSEAQASDENLMQKEEMKSRLPPFATSKSLTQEPWVRSEKILESSSTQSTGTLASREFGSHVCSASNLRSHRVPRPRARGLRTAGAVPGTLHCSWCLLHTPRRNLLPFWHLSRSKPVQGVHRAGLNLCTCRGLLGTLSWAQAHLCLEGKQRHRRLPVHASTCMVFL